MATSNCRLVCRCAEQIIRFSGFDKLVAWMNWSRTDFGILHSKCYRNRLSVCRLSNANTSKNFILLDLHAEKVMKFSKVPDGKSLSELFLHFCWPLVTLSSNNAVVHVDTLVNCLSS